MGLQQTPAGDRTHIAFFGRRNAGKSSLLNAVTGQEFSVVSEQKGTTTDPVYKSMELLPLGPVLIIDTPGIDDEGELGEQRIRKAKQVLNKTDIAVLVVDAQIGLQDVERDLLRTFEEREIPYVIAYNKIDKGALQQDEQGVFVSAMEHTGIEELKETLAHRIKRESDAFLLIADCVKPLDVVLLVTPIDASAPKGRMILPQQQVLRDVLDAGGIAVVVKETELAQAYQQLGAKPSLVITDSQVFAKVAKEIPEDVYLTSFSILMARKKGFLKTAVEGAFALDKLQDRDKVLIAEGCTHHRQCEDIGTVKLPKWIQNCTGKQVTFSVCSGTEFPEDLSAYKLVLHCGGCMLNEKEIRFRMRSATAQNVPFTNYGIAIAYMNGILERTLQVLPEV